MGGQRAIIKCKGCSVQFRREELTYYCSNKAKNGFYYCPNCLKERQSREYFSNEICSIFGVKAPNGQIWTERKHLIEEYGYTDNIIVDCLHYAYDIEKIQKKKETLFFVNPTMVDKMIKYKRNKDMIGQSLVQALQTETHEYIAPVRVTKTTKKEKLNPDDFLDE